MANESVLRRRLDSSGVLKSFDVGEMGALFTLNEGTFPFEDGDTSGKVDPGMDVESEDSVDSVDSVD